ncbi:MAG: DNA-binding domain-containing protein [Myxococcota bacterium]
MSLQATERRLVRAIVSEAPPPEVARFLTPGPRLEAAERLEIYRASYLARLVECIRDDHPLVAEALGEARFLRAAQRYVASHPSTEKSLNRFAQGFARHLGQDRSLAHRAFWRDLARLEWAAVEVVHEPEVPALSRDSLTSADPSRLVLALRPTVRLLELSYPVGRFVAARLEGRRPRPPKPRRSVVLMGRSGLDLWRMDLDRPIAAVLLQLVGGRPLAAALGSQSRLTPADVQAWFGAWVRHGVFRALGSDEKEKKR